MYKTLHMQRTIHTQHNKRHWHMIRSAPPRYHLMQSAPPRGWRPPLAPWGRRRVYWTAATRTASRPARPALSHAPRVCENTDDGDAADDGDDAEHGDDTHTHTHTHKQTNKQHTHTHTHTHSFGACRPRVRKRANARALECRVRTPRAAPARSIAGARAVRSYVVDYAGEGKP